MGRDEWSGFLIYTVEEGDINDPKNLVLKVQGMFLLDIGTSASTEFSAVERMIDVMEQFPQLMDEPEKWKHGKVHSHHYMKAYHSGTDMTDLHDQSPNFGYYTSLVVNFDKEYDCKISFVARQKNIYTHIGNDGEDVQTVTGEVEKLLLVDCDIVMEKGLPSVPEELSGMCSMLLEQKKAEEQRKAEMARINAKPKINPAPKTIPNSKNDGSSVKVDEQGQTSFGQDDGIFTLKEKYGFLKYWIAAGNIQLDAIKHMSLQEVLMTMDEIFAHYDKQEDALYEAELNQSFEACVELGMPEVYNLGLTQYEIICTECYQMLHKEAFKEYIIVDNVKSQLEDLSNHYAVQQIN